MTDGPTTPSQDSHAKRRGVRNADVPSDTLGLPGIGDEAAATHFVRDMVQGQQNDGDEKTEDHAPADLRDR